MAHVSGDDRSQLLLLPESVDDDVGSDNVVRCIDAFVDGLDLQSAGFGRVQAKATGRPGYHPADLLKLYIYGYLDRVRSSRRLEIEARRNIEVIWLLRRLTPDARRPTSRQSRISDATTGRHSARCSGSPWCCAGSSICSGVR